MIELTDVLTVFTFMLILIGATVYGYVRANHDQRLLKEKAKYINSCIYGIMLISWPFVFKTVCKFDGAGIAKSCFSNMMFVLNIGWSQIAHRRLVFDYWAPTARPKRA